MKSSGLKKASLTMLIAEFAASSVRKAELEDDAEHENEKDQEKVNREIFWGWEVRDEILGRGDEAAQQLLTLFAYPNMQVRLDAARAALKVAPKMARDMIEDVADSYHLPQSFEARMALFWIDKGPSSQKE